MQLIYYISCSILIFITIYLYYSNLSNNQQVVFHSNILLKDNDKNKCLNLQNVCFYFWNNFFLNFLKS